MAYEGNLGLVAKGTSGWNENLDLYLWRHNDFSYEISTGGVGSNQGFSKSIECLKDIPYPQALRKFKQQLRYGTFEEF